MAVFSGGFTGRGREDNPELPSGQCLTEDIPVLSAGLTPRVAANEWQLSVRRENDLVGSWNWEQCQDLGPKEIHTDCAL
jgi:hypothetical protein